MTRVDTITKLEAIPVSHDLPKGQRYGSARGQVASRAVTLVRLETADGHVGWGEGFGPPAAVVALVKELSPSVLGQPLGRIVPFVRQTLQAGYHRSTGGLHVCALSAVEMAHWDAWGRSLGVSVATLLGGRAREELHAYASTGYVLDGGNGESVYTAMLDEALATGFTAAKVKLGLGRTQDRRRAELARKWLGPDGELMIDFNGNYTADAALEVLDALKDLDIAWAEEPVPPDDLQGLTRVRRAGIPIAAGEAVYTRFGFRPLISEQRVDVVQPDVAKCGGLAEARAIVDLAHTWNLRVSPHVWGGAVAQAGAVQLLAAIPDTPHTAVAPHPLWLEYDLGVNRVREDLLVNPLRAEGGVVAVPTGPGLGVEINEDAVAELRMVDV